MLIACHLFFGLCTGLLLEQRYRDTRIIPLCLLGSILPDLIDKPLGYLIFPDIGDGRLIAHALTGLVLIGIISYVLMRGWVLTGALGAGIMGHQFLDEMWKIPVNWLYPFLGNFPVYVQENYFGWGLMRELTTPSEWAFALGMFWYVIMYQQSGPGITRLRSAALSGVPAFLLLVTGR